MKVYLGADHGGFAAKEEIKKYLSEWGYVFEDLGAHILDPDDDYPDFAYAVAKKVAVNPKEGRGILFCRSGVGMDVIANKVKDVYSAQVFNEDMARVSREKNNANILSIPTDYLDVEAIIKIVKVWLETPFSNEERHSRRLKKIEEIENSLKS